MLPLYVLNSISNPFSLVVIFSYASPSNFLPPPPPLQIIITQSLICDDDTCRDMI